MHFTAFVRHVAIYSCVLVSVSVNVAVAVAVAVSTNVSVCGLV